MIFNPGIMAAAGGGGGAVVGTYTGNGDKSRTIPLDCEPAIVIICGYVSEHSYLVTIIAGAGYGVLDGSNINAKIDGNSIVFTSLTSMNSKQVNADGGTYYYVAIPKA